MEDFKGAPRTGTIVRDAVEIEDAGGMEQVVLAPKETEADALANKARTNFVSDRIEQNMHISDIEQALINEQGASPQEARGTLIDTIKPMISSEIQRGNTAADLRAYLKQEADYPDDLLTDLFDYEGAPYRPPLLSDINAEVTAGNLDELTSAARNVHELRMPFIKSVVANLSEDREGQRKYHQYSMDLSYNIANTLRKLGRDIQVDDRGNLVEVTEGGAIPVDESILYSIADSEKEITGSVIGSVAGYKAANLVTQIPGFGKFGKLAKVGIKGASMIAGGSTGASLGRTLDITANAMRVKEELDAKHYVARMKDAGVANATWEAIGTPVFFGGAKLIQGIGKGYDLFIEGNKQGAYEALKDLMHLSDKQVDDIIVKWEQATGEKVKGLTRAKRALQVVPLSRPGGESIVSHAAGKSPKAGAAVAHMIDNRAKDLLENTGRMTNDNVGTVLHDELGKYTDTVKSYYTGIKDMALDATADIPYKFNYDKLALDPLMDRINTSLTNEAVRKRFGYYMEQIRDIGNVTAKPAETKVVTRKFTRGGKGEPVQQVIDVPAEVVKGSNEIRSFGDLLDLRKTVNEFKSNTKIRNKEDFEAVKAVLSSLDKEIARVARKEIPNGNTWLKEWRKANIEYSKMFKLKENVLYKALTKKGVNNKKIVAALQNNITAIDGTFMQVLAKLPKRVQQQTESAVLDVLAKKHTIGFESGLQATHFPNLAEELKHVGFTSPEAREMKRAVAKLAEVFKNDVDLSRSVGQVNAPGFQHYLTTNPVARIKYEAANYGFDYVKRLAPTQQGKNIALITNVAKLIENPTNSKQMAIVLKELPVDSELSTTIRKMAIEFAKWGEKESYPKVPVYRTGTPGSMAKAKDGPLGRGQYWNTSKDVIRKRARTTGGKVMKEKLLPSRIAVEQNIKDALGVEDFDMKLLKGNDELVELLKKRGYDGVSAGDEVMIFK